MNASKFVVKILAPTSEMISPHYTDVRFASFLSSGFINFIVVNPPERKLAKRTSVITLGKFDKIEAGNVIWLRLDLG
jgi:hypothetical protein